MGERVRPRAGGGHCLGDGAGRTMEAAGRRAQRNQGLDAQLLCRDRSLPLSQTEVMNLKRTPFVRSTKALDRLSILLHNGCSTHNLWRIDTAQVGNDITRLKAFREADVIHMHWVNQGMLSLSNVFPIIFASALQREEQQANAVSALMIMGLFGGTVLPLLMGVASDAVGQQGAVIVMAVAACYLVALAVKLKK